MVIMGTSAFNLLLVIGISILMAVEVKKLFNFNAFVITALFATFAFVWIFIIVQVITPGYIELWEACVTLACYPVLVFILYLNETFCGPGGR